MTKAGFRDLVRRVASHSFPRFVVVGTVGFLVDACVLKGLVVLAGVDPVIARFFSFSTALFSTWALNRAWSFAAARSDKVLREAGRYILVQLTGGAVNLAVYVALVRWVPALHGAVIWPLAAGSIAGMGVNYAGARLVVFRAAPKSEPI